MLPFDPHAFDVVVIRNVLEGLDAEARLRCAAEVHRVLRPGGRAVVIEDAARRGGLGSLFRGSSRPIRYTASGGAAHALDARASAPCARWPNAKAGVRRGGQGGDNVAASRCGITSRR